MTVSQVGAFWSYAHEDDELDGGGIVELAHRLRKEFTLITGEPLKLFIDRTGIGWGDEWRRRIDGALAETTFFIPVITPLYFNRTECRRELLEFSAQAQSLGVSDLILPIQYAKVKNLSEQNPDEAVALVSRMQYVDWTQLRLAGSLSSEYRLAVNALAIRLAEVADAIAEMQLSEERQTSNNSKGDDLGLADLFESINAVLPQWVESLETSEIVVAQLNATFAVYSERIEKAERSGPPSAQFAEMQRLAVEELPLAERARDISRMYQAKTVELDPLVLAAARMGSAHPSDKAIFDDLYSRIKRANSNVEHIREMVKSRNYMHASEWARKRAHVSRAMNKSLIPGLFLIELSTKPIKSSRNG